MKFELLQSRHFRTAMKRMAGDHRLLSTVQKQLSMLADGTITPGMDLMRVGKDPHRPIYKIRINDADRMIYEGPFKVANVNKPVLYVHDVGRHDDINSLIEHALGHIPTTEDLEEQKANKQETQVAAPPPDALTLCYRIPWPAYLDSDKFDILTSNLASALQLTPAQQETLKAPYPVLIQGQAGSGKSVVLAHHLALHLHQDYEQGQPGLQRLCVSYNKRLVEKAAEDVNAILQAAYGIETMTGVTRFLAYRDLLYELIPDAARRFEERHRVSWVRFRDAFCSNRTLHVSPELAWHAIRSFFKGACLPPSRPPLTLGDYEGRGRRFKELLEEQQIRTLFDLAKRYEDWLATEGFWDDLDLAWYALKWLLENDGPRYAEIYCDEAQDLTELDFAILIHLCNVQWEGSFPRIGLIFAGDPLQTIHPSGFRWAMVKDRIFEAVKRKHGVETSIGTSPLAENWRSDGAIVKLANEIQQLRRKYVDESIPCQLAKRDEENLPVLAALSDTPPRWLFENVLAELPPSCGVIVREEVDKLELTKAGVPADRIYTVTEAKGLEFDVAVLWRFAEGDDQWWSLVRAETTKLSENQRIPVLYFLNRLYVAVTRGIKAIFLLDLADTIEQRWQPVFGHCLRAHPLADLEKHPNLRREADRSEWKNWAMTLEDREEFDRAAISYENANETILSSRCRAKGYRMRGDYPQAAWLFETTNDWFDAAEAYFDARMWQKAYIAAARSPEGVKAKRLEARAFFNWKKENREFAEAVGPLLQMIRSLAEQDSIWIRHAAQALRELNRNEEAGDLFHRIGDFESAARCFLNCRRWQDALSAFVQAGSEETGRYHAEGEVEVFAGNFTKAIDCFRRAKQWQRMLDCCARVKDVSGQVESLKKLGRVPEAIAVLEAELTKSSVPSQRRELWELLKTCALEMQDWILARKAAEELGQFFEEASYAEKAGEDPRVVKRLEVRAHQEAHHYFEAANLLEQLGELCLAQETRAKGMIQEKKYSEAAAIFGQLLFVKSFRKCHNEGMKRTQNTKDDAGLDEQVTAKVFDWLGTILPKDWMELKTDRHRVDREELSELCKKYPYEFAEAWKNYSPEVRGNILTLIPGATKSELLDVDALDFIAAMIDRSHGKLTRDEQKRLAQALEDAEEIPLPWRKRFTLREMGIAWELTGNHLKTAKWYEGIFDDGSQEPWILEAAIAARSRQREHAIASQNSEQMDRIGKNIERLRAKLASLERVGG